MGNVAASGIDLGTLVPSSLDINLPSKAVLSFLRTKVWRVNLKGAYNPRENSPSPTSKSKSEKLGIVVFRHDGRSGQKTLIVNNTLIHKSSELLDGGDMINFELNRKPCRLEVINFPGLSEYVLYYDDIRIKSIMEEREPADMERPKVRIPRAHIIGPYTSSESSRGTVLYEINTVLNDKETVVRRRFSDFDELDCLVRSVFQGHHLSSNLPPLPSKHMKLLMDHTTSDFVEQRRIDLEVFLRRLINVPHVTCDPDLLEFLGLQ